MTRENKDRLWAGLATLLIAAALVVWLLFHVVTWDRSAVAASAIPETGADEELFIDPELTDLGEEETQNFDEPSASALGEPEKSETESQKLVVPDDNPNPAPPVEKPITQKKESPVKATTPSKTDEEAQKIKSSMANKFSPHSGKSDGKAGSNGSGGTGVGIQGNATGRQFISCPKPDVTLRHKTVVVVNVVVAESGKVTSASATGSASAEIRRACEQAARKARWKEKKGVGDSRGTITFTITPK